MKKLIAMVLVLGVLSVFVAGCSGGGDAAATDGAKPTDAAKTGEKTGE